MAYVEALLEHETVDIHVRHQFKNQAIHYSSMKGHNDILVKLIEKGADVSAKGSNGRTPLLMTAASGRVECMKTLLHHGAQVNQQNSTTDDANIHVSRHFSAVDSSSTILKGHNDIWHVS